MAERALVSVAGGIISGVVGPLAAQEITLLWNFRKELRKLESTVSTINAVLEDAEAQQGKSSAVRNWLEKLTDVLYDADDLVDVLSTEARRRKARTQGKGKKVRMFFLKSKKLVHDLKMAHKIKDIREKLDAIKDEKNFHLEKCCVETRVRDRDTYSLLGKDEVIVGREDDMKAVIERFEANDDRNILAVPIVGIGGLGKTALAKLIYNNNKFTERFNLKMWVCVSDDFNVKIIVRQILGCITKEKPRDDTINSAADFLSEKIHGKTFFLVLDDVWNDVNYEKWCDLKNLLGGDGKGNKVLVTTRFTSVAEIMHLEPYILKGLGEDESWQLFKQHAFENEQDPVDTSKRDIGMEIIRKCAGVPLALRTLGGMLYSKNLNSWMDFKEKEFSTISSNDGTYDIMATLKLSYDKLSSRLKQCFVYCCLFPKDYKYNEMTLINLWIAEGFVESQENQCVEDIGHNYFMDLLYGSFFQEPRVGYFDNVMKCKMHDLMHDLAIEMARSYIGTIGDRMKNISKKTRFIGFHANRDISPIKQFSFEANKIRAILCPKTSRFIYSKGEIDCEVIFSNFKSLRVLDLSQRKLKDLSSSINKLRQLRYLDLSQNTSLKQLPESITRLENLQTLILFECKSLEKLPRDFAKLINLRYLDLEKCTNLRYMPPKLGQLINLERLNYFFIPKDFLSHDCSRLNELNGLNKLRGNLNIHVRDTTINMEAMNLKQKSYLTGLSLSWSDFYDNNNCVNDISHDGLQSHPNMKDLKLENYQNSRLPTWILSLTSLVKLNIDKCNKFQDVSSLSQLPCLKKLELWYMEDLKYISKRHDMNRVPFSSSSSSACIIFFPMLEKLWVHHCRNLKEWWKMDSSTKGESSDHSLPSFPRLLDLDVRKCPMLNTLPMCPNLERLKICGSYLTPVSSTIRLSKLKSIDIAFNHESETLPEWWAQNLPSLEKLHIYSFKKLKCVRSIQHLTALKHLDFSYCPKLDLVNDENGIWQGPTSLQSLCICGCYSLMVIPKWIENCKSLKRLTIEDCHNFNSQRCKKETGEDWLKIAHIPNVRLITHSG